MEPVSSVTRATSTTWATPTPPTESASGAFGPLLERMLGEASRAHGTADQAVKDLALGKSDDLHSVALAVARADLSFRMVLEVRNRMIEAYQEIMRMQV
jgi:flagellar hook-basal body complex protein FliE